MISDLIVPRTCSWIVKKVVIECDICQLESSIIISCNNNATAVKKEHSNSICMFHSIFPPGKNFQYKSASILLGRWPQLCVLQKNTRIQRVFGLWWCQQFLLWSFGDPRVWAEICQVNIHSHMIIFLSSSSPSPNLCTTLSLQGPTYQPTPQLGEGLGLRTPQHIVFFSAFLSTAITNCAATQSLLV